MKTPSTMQIATACRALGTAVARDLVVSRPRGVIVYAGKLAPVEVRFLVEGMDTLAVNDVSVIAIDGEDREIVGYLLGRVLRIQIQARRLDELNDILHAPAGAS